MTDKPITTTPARIAEPVAQCCMCGKMGLSTVEDGGPECQLWDGRWTCGRDCYDAAVAVREGSSPSPVYIAQVRAEAVAGAYAAAADRAFRAADDADDQGYDGDGVTGRQLARAILALTPDDAQAALSRRDAKVRKAALREAADAAYNYLASVDCYEDLVSSHLEDAILALIKEPTHE